MRITLSNPTRNVFAMPPQQTSSCAERRLVPASFPRGTASCPDALGWCGLSFAAEVELSRGPFSLAQRRFLAQDMVVMLGKAVRFVTDVLQQPQGEGMSAEPQWFGRAGEIDFLFALGQ